jgi:voltage-gated potassium channel
VIHLILALLRPLKRPPAMMRALLLCVAVILYGASGFLYFETPERPDLGWADAFWYALVTLTTIGYGDFFPTTLAGRYLVAVPMMLFGVGLLGYVLSVAASTLVQAKTRELHGMANVSFKDHLVIFNFPSLGKVLRVLEELRTDASFRDRSVVLIDEDLTELPPELAALDLRFIRGDPTRDATLDRANLDRASHAVVLSPRPGDPHSDALSITITLAIEARARGVITVVECVEPGAEELLRKAGCDHVVCTSRFDAHFLGSELLNPGVQQVLAQLTSTIAGDEELYLTVVTAPSSFGALAERCRGRGHLAIGVRAASEVKLNPPGAHAVAAGDAVISIGPRRLAPSDLG